MASKKKPVAKMRMTARNTAEVEFTPSHETTQKYTGLVVSSLKVMSGNDTFVEKEVNIRDFLHLLFYCSAVRTKDEAIAATRKYCVPRGKNTIAIRTATFDKAWEDFQKDAFELCSEGFFDRMFFYLGIDPKKVIYKRDIILGHVKTYLTNTSLHSRGSALLSDKDMAKAVDKYIEKHIRKAHKEI